jgi:D-glycero-alpha-D-manno-heptose-7-phosphate kinase
LAVIISKCPVRISLSGGGSDYPSFYTNNPDGGAVITSTINKYCYLFVRYLPPFFEHKHRIVYSKIELPSDLDSIDHPSVRECLRYMKVDRGVEIHHAGDLPARSGVGSSSAFTVGLLHALHALNGQKISKYDLALEAIHVEQDLIGEHVGSQDQMACALGSFNYIKFGNRKPIVESLNITEKRVKDLENCLMLVFTGFPHMASEIAKTYNFKEREKEIKEIMAYTKDVYKILTGGEILDYGRILHETWQLKKSLSKKISTPYIDFIYSKALEYGASGGRLIGSGNAGFMVLFCEPDKQIALRNSEVFKGLLFVPIKFETSESCGSRILSMNGD